MSGPENPALARTLMDVPVQVDVVLGDVRLSIDELLALSVGDALALDRGARDEIDIYVSDRLMARGRLVVADDQLGVTLTEIVDQKMAA